MIRGKRVNQALATLQFTNKRAADAVEACVRSAIANATEAAEKANVAVDPDDLWIKEAFVDKGPTKSRFRTRPAPQGRAYRERRHFCHVSVILSSDEMPTDAKKANGSSRRSAQDGTRAVKKSAPAKAAAKPKVKAAPPAETATEATPDAAVETTATNTGETQANDSA
jgi:large subunit ribosomal protein L22